MASIHKRGGNYYCQFSYAKKRYTVAIGPLTKTQAEAKAEAIQLLLASVKRGHVTIPSDVEVSEFFFHDGRPPAPPPPKPKSVIQLTSTFGQVRDLYLTAVNGSLEDSTLYTLGVHFRQLGRTYDDNHPFAFDIPTLQQHIARRAKDKTNRGTVVDAATIRKEIMTLRSCYYWAADSKIINAEWPDLKGLRYPKRSEKLPWMTYAECERIGTSEAWESLFLMPDEIEGLLEHVLSHAKVSWLYPAIVTASYTGMRRSELLRAQKSDVDLKQGFMLVQERKRSKSRTVRRVPLAGRLRTVLEEHMQCDTHPNLFTQFHVKYSNKKRTGHEPLTRDEAHNAFKKVCAKSKWDKLRGFHVLRHSFISACVMKGINQRTLDGWVGHTSDIREHYQHLTPEYEKEQIADVFG